MNVIAVSDVHSRVGQDIQPAACRFRHDADVARVVEIDALVIRVQLDAEETALLDKIERPGYVLAVRMDRAGEEQVVFSVQRSRNVVDRVLLLRAGRDGEYNAVIDPADRHRFLQSVQRADPVRQDMTDIGQMKDRLLGDLVRKRVGMEVNDQGFHLLHNSE